ncbi:Putative protein of unknown function [Podospora comata]|uniref:Uncharacterized protein n=1 Tax=Podospora comata TaxID=48703 RepID=A0ABY6S9E1_PODCO|nr:Putative protein of unknown function [Podospora comata]
MRFSTLILASLAGLATANFDLYLGHQIIPVDGGVLHDGWYIFDNDPSKADRLLRRCRHRHQRPRDALQQQPPLPLDHLQRQRPSLQNVWPRRQDLRGVHPLPGRQFPPHDQFRRNPQRRPQVSVSDAVYCSADQGCELRCLPLTGWLSLEQE